MKRSALFSLVTLVSLGLASFALAAQPTESLLPATTKGYVSTHDIDEVRTKFNETQLGEMVADPVMKPFIDDLRKQIGAKLEKAGKRLGVKWEDMEGVYAGESALAVIQPDPKDKNSHATVLIVDITGKRDKADELLAKVDENQKADKAVRSELKSGGVDRHCLYAAARSRRKGRRAELLLHQGRNARHQRSPKDLGRDHRPVRRQGDRFAGYRRGVQVRDGAEPQGSGWRAAPRAVVRRADRLCGSEPGGTGRSQEARHRHAQDLCRHRASPPYRVSAATCSSRPAAKSCCTGRMSMPRRSSGQPAHRRPRTSTTWRCGC